MNQFISPDPVRVKVNSTFALLLEHQIFFGRSSSRLCQYLSFIKVLQCLKTLHKGNPKPETYSELCQTSEVERFTKIVIGFQTLAIFAIRSVLLLWQGFEYVFPGSLQFTDLWGSIYRVYYRVYLQNSLQAVFHKFYLVHSRIY